MIAKKGQPRQQHRSAGGSSRPRALPGTPNQLGPRNPAPKERNPQQLDAQGRTPRGQPTQRFSTWGAHTHSVSSWDDVPLRAALWEALLPQRAHKGNAELREVEPQEAGPPETKPREATITPSAWRIIGREVLSLHAAYTAPGGEQHLSVLPLPQRLRGYQAYYLPRNLHRVRATLQALPWCTPPLGKSLIAPWMDPSGTLRVLDLGCGTGAFSLAWLQWQLSCVPQPWPKLHVTLVDRSRALLTLAVRNLRAYLARVAPQAQVELEEHAEGVAAYVSHSAGAQFAVIGAAMMLNELQLLGPRRRNERALRFAAALRARLQPKGLLLVVEPGTRKGYMHLIALREGLTDCAMLYPCPHAQPCPLWHPTVRKWCHATLKLPPGFFFDQDLRTQGKAPFAMRTLNMVALALQRGSHLSQGHPQQAELPFQARQGARVISAEMDHEALARAAWDTPRTHLLADQKQFWAMHCLPNGQLRLSEVLPHGQIERGAWRSWPLQQVEASPAHPPSPRGPRAAGKPGSAFPKPKRGNPKERTFKKTAWNLPHSPRGS